MCLYKTGDVLRKICVLQLNKDVSKQSANSDGICHSKHVYIGRCRDKPFSRSVCMDLCRIRDISCPSNDMFGQGHYIMAITW